MNDFIIHSGWEFNRDQLKEKLEPFIGKEECDEIKARVYTAVHYFRDFRQSDIHNFLSRYEGKPVTAYIRKLYFRKAGKRRNATIVAEGDILGKPYYICMSYDDVSPMAAKRMANSGELGKPIDTNSLALDVQVYREIKNSLRGHGKK